MNGLTGLDGNPANYGALYLRRQHSKNGNTLDATHLIQHRYVIHSG
jgi:hypothetical protein